MTMKILLVDDEPNVLQGFKRNLRNQYDLHFAVGGAAALEMIETNGPFAVVVSDMQMPEMSGVELLSIIRDRNEQTVRVMLTGNADQKTAVDAVNEGNIFRFLNKPCPPDQLAKTLDAGLQQYRLVTAEAELLNQTLAGSVRMLTQVLSMAMPEAFGLTGEARALVRAVAQRIGVGPMWQIEMAAMLMRVGCVSLPADVIDRYLNHQPLSSDDEALIKQTPKLGHDLISAIPRLQGVADLVAAQNDPACDPTPIAARILRAVGDFQRFRGDGSPLAALRLMDRRPQYDPVVVEHLSAVVQAMFQSQDVDVAQLTDGMVLESHVTDLSGRILIASGTEIHDSLIQKLVRLRRSQTGVCEPISVRTVVRQAATTTKTNTTDPQPVTAE